MWLQAASANSCTKGNELPGHQSQEVMIAHHEELNSVSRFLIHSINMPSIDMAYRWVWQQARFPNLASEKRSVRVTKGIRTAVSMLRKGELDHPPFSTMFSTGASFGLRDFLPHF